MTIWCMPFKCRVTKATNTHSRYITLNAFPLQKLLHENASIVRYTYIVLLSKSSSKMVMRLGRSYSSEVKLDLLKTVDFITYASSNCFGQYGL